ncbi:MAG: sigma-70 family RNA polymerase sigma factor [Planctomycetes bacterium]|nr:sigma-70 family RNA polymerase sigma factor [Planctomycetota bacterium]
MAGLEQIYTEHRQGLFTLALTITRRPELAEDAVHEAFVRLCRSTSQRSGDPVAYVFASVRNAAIDQLRRRPKDRSESSIFAAPVSPAATPMHEAADAERDRLVREALEQLPDDQRQVIVMKLYGNLTFEQIAAAHQEPLSTISSRYRRGLDRLRASVESLV